MSSPINTCYIKRSSFFSVANYDLVSCKVTVGETTTEHFMVFTETEFLLVNPHKSRLGCGVVHFISFLQVCREKKDLFFFFFLTQRL